MGQTEQPIQKMHSKNLTKGRKMYDRTGVFLNVFNIRRYILALLI